MYFSGTLIICIVWFTAFVGGCSVLFADYSQFSAVKDQTNFCEFVQYSDYQSEYLIFVVAFISFFMITFTYIRIYIEVSPSIHQTYRIYMQYKPFATHSLRRAYFSKYYSMASTSSKFQKQKYSLLIT